MDECLEKLFLRESEFSAAELAGVLRGGDAGLWVAAIVGEARRYESGEAGLDSLVFSRIMHSLGCALREVFGGEEVTVGEALAGVDEKLDADVREWLRGIGLGLDGGMRVSAWADEACGAAFGHLGRAMSSSGERRGEFPRSVLRSDEIVWGRAPARFDTGGGWTDTPPYSLEYGGRVVGTAVDLNGQPPIQVYARVIEAPVVRIHSIDLGRRIEIKCLEELLDYRDAGSDYGLCKGAIALSGFSPEVCGWPEGTGLEEMLMSFGGGLELTTLAAIPKGSGLGTSSIMGAVIISVIERVMGRTLSGRELFNRVLQLEQSLTTGGGWQDQIGGAVGGVKIITAEAGLTPDAVIHYLPSDLVDPRGNGGRTLLYYTGITRLAKNILEQVVGRVLNRDRHTMRTLKEIYAVAGETGEAISRKDMAGFGELIDRAWELNKRLDPNSTNEQVEDIMSRVRRFVYGAKLLGAGGGGFMLMVCKSGEDAGRVREMLGNEPPNERARFFDYNVNADGLVVTVC